MTCGGSSGAGLTNLSFVLKSRSMPENLKENYDKILRKINAYPNTTLIVVSKNQPIEKVLALYKLGHRDFGENYVQELVKKAEALKQHPEIKWHFIGHLQTNKVKTLLPWVYSIHTVDSFKQAEKLAQELPDKKTLPIFIQVNIDNEKTKSGVLPDEVLSLAEKIVHLKNLHLLGLMCIPKPPGAKSFKELKLLEKKCQPFTQGKLSMGMSEDFEQALAEGATHLRIGRAILCP